MAMSLLGVAGWGLAIAVIHLFGLIFNQKPVINVTHFVIIPAFLILLSMLLNFFEMDKKWQIKPSKLTAFLTTLHGTWGLYVSLQINDIYNGYLVLFLFSFGLSYLKISYGFWVTLAFSAFHLLLALAMIFALQIKIGTDEYIFFLFFGFYGVSSAFVNELNRRRSLHLKSAIAERKHGYEQLEKILFPHQIKRIVSGASVESTLPIQQGFGCCVLFEVVDSAKIKHELAQEYIREIFRLFSLQLRESYDSEAQISNGFRVVEMNNKFVCTVGFPFHCPNNERPSRLSLKIARHFIQVFQDNILKMDYYKPIYCSVVIAAGELEGFFTRGFPIEYQLHGEPLIKAEQINELRKHAHVTEALRGSTLVIQDRVFNSLRSSERQDFAPIEMNDGLSHADELVNLPRLYVQRIEVEMPNSAEEEVA
jgi:hypothetical protein